MERDFALALLSAPTPKIIGVGMRPFSVGHSLLLEQIESSFVCGTFPTYDDLVSTAFICAHDWRENKKLLRSPLRRWMTCWLWGKLAGNFDIAKAVIELHQYIQDGNEFPEVRKKDGMRSLSMPHSARLYTFLRGLGMGEDESMNFPMRAANILYCAEQEQTGRLELLADSFKEMIRASQGGKAA